MKARVNQRIRQHETYVHVHVKKKKKKKENVAKYQALWRNKHLDGKRGTRMNSLPRDHWVNLNDVRIQIESIFCLLLSDCNGSRLSERSPSGQLDSSNWPIFQQVYLPSIRNFDRPLLHPRWPRPVRVEFNKSVYDKLTTKKKRKKKEKALLYPFKKKRTK